MKMPKIPKHIDSLRVTDLDQVSAILDAYTKTTPAYFTEEEIAHIKQTIQNTLTGNTTDKSEHYILYRDIDKNVIAFAGYRKCRKSLLPFTFSPKPLELYALYVHPKFAHKSTGTKLLNHIVCYARDKIYTEVIVKFAHKFKKTANKFYEKMGFEHVGELNTPDRDTFEVFRLKL